VLPIQVPLEPEYFERLTVYGKPELVANKTPGDHHPSDKAEFAMFHRPDLPYQSQAFLGSILPASEEILAFATNSRIDSDTVSIISLRDEPRDRPAYSGG
jgi:hypothetical protein